MINLCDFNQDQQFRITQFLKFYDKDRVCEFNQRYIDRKTHIYDSMSLSYSNIVLKTVKLFKELGLSNVMDVSIIYEYLLWNGYFSIDKSFKYSLNKRRNITSLFGADIMNGYGACLNINSMLVKILVKLGYQSHLIGMSLPNLDYTFSYLPNIKRSVDTDLFVSKSSKNEQKLIPLDERANHGVCIVKENGSYKYVDAHNLLFANNIDILKARYLGLNKEIDIDVIPYVTLLDECLQYSDFESLFLDIFNNINTFNMRLDEIKKVYEYVLRLCENRICLFNDFYDEIKSDIDNVCRVLNY